MCAATCATVNWAMRTLSSPRATSMKRKTLPWTMAIKWSMRAAQAWNVTTHGRTTGYRSAANELAWLDGARRGKICATAELPEVEAAAQVWTGYAKRAWRPGGRIAPTPTPEERRALSHFRVEPARSAMGAPMRPGDATHARAADWRFKKFESSARCCLCVTE